MQSAQNILKQYFGFESFRPGQGELVEAILSARDTLGVMPTGAGKSLCYQVPALLFSGLTIVVSPLISLMQDQVQALREAGVPAACLNSALSPAELGDTLYEARQGRYKLLYVAPERLMTPEFLSLSREMPVSMLTVDEAHCISQWGQDFRPSYLQILDFLQTLPQRPLVSAFTATATQTVRDDIVRALGLIDPFVKTTGFDRPNLYFAVERPPSKPQALLRLIAARAGKSGIVYCATRKTVEDVCEMLCAKGLSAARYHAGLPPEERERNQNDFLYDRVSIMVATNAFGMGIDKSNVSFVIHYNMPKNMESYYQEAGRAGRDGEPADCILLYSGKDVHTAQFLIERSHEVEEDSIDPETRAELIARDMERLRQMTFYATTTECLRRSILRYFGEDAPVSCGHCGNCDTTFEQIDATVDAQKILSCVYRLAERRLHFGKGVVTAVLCANKNEKIESFGLETLSTYGIMSEQTAVRVRQLIDVLIERGFLAADPERYNALFLTGEGNALMRGRGSFVLSLPREKKRAQPETDAAGSGGALFERLRRLRGKIAAKAHVPPYVIFSNATLSDMAARQPITEFEFLACRGVGEAKAAKYGEAFLEEIKAFLREQA
ncbi:DNA helicase RecQ [Agathobaculum sp.]|uniref:DNA helicase RecQ n=1 Tax=Agathobaculum sp. TaxID=2048138 RepID=UPI002A80EDAD|nr:DNA helicase RecQ [Agathobaculum sp.]MDY3618358.1 DNA helicase RecQ [Agathobaculum sp.]